MGGTEGSRGYLYQGIVSVIESFSIPGWDKIYIEYPSENDKVDIALEKEGNLLRSIQVKSTIDSFSAPDLVTWIKDLVADKSAEEYQLILVGNCDSNAQKLKKSVEKYYNNNIDEEAKSALKQLESSFLDEHKLSFNILPYDVNYLMGISVAALHQLLSLKELVLSHDRLAFVVAALVNDHMILSTTGQGCKREDFDAMLDARIKLIIKAYSPKRISLGIRSFSRGAESMENETEKMLCLLDKFSERFIKDEYNWNQDVLINVNNFLISSTTKEEAYQLSMDTHSSIAFAAGRLMDTKRGINISPIQKTATETLLWERDPLDNAEYSTWNVRHERLSNDVFDTALILNITKDIYNRVTEYIAETSLSISRIINCSLHETPASKYSIVNGTHCAQLASSIDAALSTRATTERRATLHIFSSAPNAFMFYLGQGSRGFSGSIVLYEYDFEQVDCCTYYPTIQF